MTIQFESYKIAHDLPEQLLTTFIHHDKPAAKKLWTMTYNPQHTNMPDGNLRLTSVAVLIPTGQVFIGLAACSESDTFNKKAGFNIAYGRALQQLTCFLRNKIIGFNSLGNPILQEPTMCVDIEADHKDIGRWIHNKMQTEKLDFVKRVLQRRLEKDFKKALKFGYGAAVGAMHV